MISFDHRDFERKEKRCKVNGMGKRQGHSWIMSFFSDRKGVQYNKYRKKIFLFFFYPASLMSIVIRDLFVRATHPINLVFCFDFVVSINLFFFLVSFKSRGKMEMVAFNLDGEPVPEIRPHPRSSPIPMDPRISSRNNRLAAELEGGRGNRRAFSRKRENDMQIIDEILGIWKEEDLKGRFLWEINKIRLSTDLKIHSFYSWIKPLIIANIWILLSPVKVSSRSAGYPKTIPAFLRFTGLDSFRP